MLKYSSALFLFLFVLTLISCKDDDEIVIPADIQRKWNMVEKTGGFAGADCQYAAGEITYDFINDSVVIITVNQMDTSTVCASFLDSGSYPYSILEQSAESYLFINQSEYGLMVEEDGNLRVDGDFFSIGPIADNFSYLFSPE